MEDLNQAEKQNGFSHRASPVAAQRITFRYEDGARLVRFFSDMTTFMADKIRLDELTKSHWGEIATNQEFLKLDLDHAKYVRLAETNSLVVVSAREGDAMIGYAVFVVSCHLHYKTVLMAMEDVHYIHPTYRGRGIGTGMIQEAERVLRARGVKILTMRVKLKSDHGELLEDLGFTPIERVYAKVLGES